MSSRAATHETHDAESRSWSRVATSSGVAAAPTTAPAAVRCGNSKGAKHLQNCFLTNSQFSAKIVLILIAAAADRVASTRRPDARVRRVWFSSSGCAFAMSFCDTCGDLYRIEAAHGASAAKGTEGLVAQCTSCGKVENVVTALAGGKTTRSSGGETFLFKFGIEPMNPDGTKFGAVTEVQRERAVVDEKCPKCEHKGLNFYTMQLRSVDEGQTVFYECPQCGYTFSQNN